MNGPNPNPSKTSGEPPGNSGAGGSAPVRLGRWIFGGIVVILVALVAGALPKMRAKREVMEQSKELATPTVLVTQPTRSQAGPDLALPAEVRPREEAAVYARANGYLKRWVVDLGSRVEAGQLLAEIDTPELNQELARSKAEIQRAEASLALARTTAGRWRELLKSESVSAQEVAEKEADLALKIADLQAAQAESRRIEENLGFARVTAPFAGVITRRQAEVGQLINTSSNRELFRLADIGSLRVFVHVPQNAARAMQPGAEADLTLTELPGRTFPAKVVRTAGAVDPATRTLLTELEVDNSRQEILAGSFAQIRFRHRTSETRIIVPSNTLIFRAEGVLAAVVDGTSHIRIRKLKLGRDFGPTVEILDGLQVTDRVVLNPADSISEGMEVRIISTTTSTSTSTNAVPGKP